MAFYPKANRTIRGISSGSHVSGPYKGVLHTTEGTSASGAIGAFKSNNSWPHFLIDGAGAVWQFLDTSIGGRALRNLAGGVQTNLDSAIQIEIVGFAGKPNEHPPAQMAALKDLMRWVETTVGVKSLGPGRPFATAYGQTQLRFTNKEWDAFAAWCGHCHVPENNHWDPGALDMSFLLATGPTPPPPAPPPPPTGFTVPASYYTEVSIVPFTTPRTQGGYIVVGGDGGVFTYDAPFHGSLGGVALSSPIVDAAWTPSGSGYWLMSADGAIFAFGDGSYKGGFNALDVATRGNRKPIGLVAKGNGYRIVAIDSSADGSPFDHYDFGV